MKSIATVFLAAILSAAAFPSFSQNQASGLKRTAGGLKETAAAGGEGSGDVAGVNITTSSPLTGGTTCASGTCAFTLGLGTVPATKGGTGLTTFTLGDIMYSSAANTLSKLAGNTTTTRKLLSQTGDGVDSAAPSWVPIYDIPCDLGEEECVYQPPAGFSVGINSDLLYLGIEDGTSRLGVTPAGVIVHEKLRLNGTAKEQRDITTLATTGTILGANVLCSTGGGAVVGTLDADAATDGRFVYVTRSGGNACTVAVESGHTLDGVTDGTSTLGDGASKAFKQASSTAWVTATSWPDVPGNAATATALAANPADCSAGQFATTIAASGALGCEAIEAGDVPTLNQSTTGSAATLTTPRAIYGNNFDGSAALTQVIGSAFGGTGNGFTLFSGPTTSEKTFTLPNASATILTGTPTIGAVPYLSATGIMSDTPEVRESADIMSQRNGTSSQERQIYATYSGAGANYERLVTRTLSTSVWRWMTEKAGTGATRSYRWGIDGTDYLFLTSSSLTVAGQAMPSITDTYNVGGTANIWMHLYNNRGQQGAKSKALVDATATNVWQVAVASNSYEGFTLDYTIFATDGTDRQVIAGSTRVAVLNNAGTETCVFGTASEAVNTSTGTLTVAFDCTAGTDTVMIRANADTSLASTTTFTIESRPNLTSGTATVTPQ